MALRSRSSYLCEKLAKQVDSLIRRNHKERSQPANRARLGLLEKHKDYVHRARDYKSKKDRIRKLREKAAFRNKDEFYWGMIKGKTKVRRVARHETVVDFAGWRASPVERQ